MPPRTISVQVPESAAEGDTLTFQAEGKELEICLPQGVSPLDVLQIQVEVDSKEEGEGETTSDSDKQNDKSAAVSSINSISEIQLSSGQTLTFDVSPPERQGKSDSIPPETSKSHSQPDDDGTHAMIWPSTRILVSNKENLWDWVGLKEITTSSHASIRILELGAGLGCLSMALACHVSGMSDNDRRLYCAFDLTDHPSALPLLKANVEKNRALWSKDDTSTKRSLSIDCKPLDWNDHLQDNQPKYDVVVGSDLLYNVEQIPALIRTLDALLSDTGGIVLWIVRWRKPDLERAFFEETTKRHHIRWTLIKEEMGESQSLQLPCHLNWDEFGDPANDRSNKYFSGGLQISVNGSPRSLVDITENEANRMTELEYEQWERAHIQVYRGERFPPRKSSASTSPPSKKQKAA